MSTTTNFKRIALVAVAALGLGVLSSVPSQATINSDAVTLSSATAVQTTAETYTAASSAVVTVSFFGAAQDSISITAALVSTTATGNTSMPVLRLVETSSAIIDTVVALAGAGATGFAGSIAGTEVLANVGTKVIAASSSVSTIAKYAVYLATSGAATAAPTTAGTYVVRLTPTAQGVGPLIGATAKDLTITVSTAAVLSKNADAALSKAWMVAYNSQTPAHATQSADSSVVAVKTSSQTPVATIWVKGVNASGVTLTNTGESLTATITGAGTLSTQTAFGTAGTPLGRSISVRQTDFVQVYPDGNAGVGTITITGSVSGTLLTTKKVTFSSDKATKYTAPTIAATDSSVIAVAGTTKVSVLPQDAESYLVTGLGATDIYAFSSDTAVATVATPAYEDATVGYSAIVTGVKVGTAEIIFGNASTLAASTIKSVGKVVRVGSSTPSSVTVTTDKATYSPGEKITMTVTILDSTGKNVVGATSYANIFSSTGVTASYALQSGTLPAATIADYSNVTNTKTFTLYAPINGGTLTFSWTGGTALATANQVAGTKVVTVTDSGAAALAAVTALATTVASLKTLITTLTNLVLKIQKKVKA